MPYQQCTKCGENNILSARNCLSCGSSLKDSKMVGVQAESPVLEAAKVERPGYGETIEPGIYDNVTRATPTSSNPSLNSDYTSKRMPFGVVLLVSTLAILSIVIAVLIFK